MKPEDLDTIIAIVILVFAWINIFRYIISNRNKPCGWHIRKV